MPGKKKLHILIILDGARYDVMSQLFDAGELPFLRSITSHHRVIPCVSTFPTTTGPAHLPMLTGRTPGECNIPGIRWFDRFRYTSRKFFQRFRSYVGFGAFLIDADLRKGTPVIYSKYSNPFGVFASINRGLPFSNRLGYLKRVYLNPYGRLTGEWMDADVTAAELVKAAIRKNADFIHAVFPAIDELSHHGHPLSEEVMEAYRQFDRIFRTIYDLATREGYREIKFAVVSDHGLWKTYSHLDLDRLLEKHFGDKVFYYPKTIRAWKGPEIINMISGNGMSHIYVRSGKGWSEPPDPEEIIRKGIVDILLEREEVDQVMVRNDSTGVTVYTARGKALLQRDSNGRINYTRIEGDPLDIGADLNATEDEFLERTLDRKYPDAPHAVLQLLKSPRSGDVFVTAKRGYDLRAREFEIPEHLSTHGSLHREHMMVPLITNFNVDGRNWFRTSDVYYLFVND